MHKPDNSSANKKAGLEQLREEIANGLRYTHLRANTNARKMLEIASFAYAAIDLMVEKGLLSIDELDNKKNEVAGRLAKRFADEGMGMAYQDKEQDKYLFESVQIDCENRISLCKAACCRLRFALSKQDVEEGIVKWNFAYPYFIARGADGYCIHMKRGQLNCSVHEHRPVPCRGYDCRNDKRIWADFEHKIVSPELEKLFQSPDGVDISEDSDVSQQ